jgi:hypothetical protein
VIYLLGQILRLARKYACIKSQGLYCYMLVLLECVRGINPLGYSCIALLGLFFELSSQLVLNSYVKASLIYSIVTLAHQ